MVIARCILKVAHRFSQAQIVTGLRSKGTGVTLYMNIACQVCFSCPDLFFVIYLISYPFNFGSHMIGEMHRTISSLR